MSYPVTELQLAILDVLWTAGEASVYDIHDRLREERRVAQSTVSTLLNRMEDRELVSYRESGRLYLYRAEVDREQIRRSMAAEFLEHTRALFKSDLGLMVSHLVEEGEATPDDIARATEMLASLQDTARTEEDR